MPHNPSTLCKEGKEVDRLKRFIALAVTMLTVLMFAGIAGATSAKQAAYTTAPDVGVTVALTKDEAVSPKVLTPCAALAASEEMGRFTGAKPIGIRLPVKDGPVLFSPVAMSYSFAADTPLAQGLIRFPRDKPSSSALLSMIESQVAALANQGALISFLTTQRISGEAAYTNAGEVPATVSPSKEAHPHSGHNA